MAKQRKNDKSIIAERIERVFSHAIHQSHTAILNDISTKIWASAEFKRAPRYLRSYWQGRIDEKWATLSQNLEERYLLRGAVVRGSDIPAGEWEFVIYAGKFWIGTDKLYSQ